MLDVILSEAEYYVNDERVDFEGPHWQYDCYWVYVTFNEVLVGVVLFDEEGKRLSDSTPRSIISKKIQSLDND